MRITLTIVFWIVFVIIIHMIVFVTSGKTVADNLGFIGVIAHTFVSLYLARFVARKITEPKTLPSGQPVSVAKARAKALDEAIARGDLKEEDLQNMMDKIQGRNSDGECGTESTSRALREAIDSRSARLTTLTDFNNHDRCLALLVPATKFAQNGPDKAFQRFTSDSCLFELIAYTVFSTDFWQYNNNPDLREKIQDIISRQIAVLCSESGLLAEEVAYEYLGDRLAVYGSVVSEGGDARALHTRLQQALLYAAEHSTPQKNTMECITVSGALDAFDLSMELIEWDMFRMKLMDSILPHMD